MRNLLKDVLLTFTVFAIVCVIFNTLFVVVTVTGNSMQPTYSEGDKLLMLRSQFYKKDYKRGDIVVADLDGVPVVKMVGGVYPDTIYIRDKKIYNNELLMGYNSDDNIAEGNTWQLEQNDIFLIGRNMGESIDSRTKGPIKANNIFGIVKLKIPQMHNNNRGR